MEEQENFGGARRNRTADNGFADHCLTTGRPPRWEGMRFGRVKPGESEASPVHFSALQTYAACRSSRSKPATTRTGLAGGGGQLGLGSAGFVDNGGTDQVAPLGPRAVVVANLAEAQQILEAEPGVRTALASAAVGDHFVLSVA